MPPNYGETWVYESLVGAIPGLDLSEGNALAIQLVLFEVAALVVAAVYGLWDAVPAATAAILVAVVGSWLMLTFSRTIRELQPPEPYRRLLFGSSIEVALGVVAFVLLVTYLFVVDPRGSAPTLLEELLGPKPPVIAVALLLLICWDVVYRIGTCWWATVAGFWRALRFSFDRSTTRRLTRLDALNVAFAGVQVMLVPFVADHPILRGAVVRLLAAVVLVATASVLLQRRRVEAD